MAILTLNPTVAADADGTVKFGSGEKNQNVRRRDISSDGDEITPIQAGVDDQRHVITGGRVSVSGAGSIDIYSETTLRDRLAFIGAATATFPVGWEAGEGEDLAIRNPDGLTVTGWIEWVTVKNGEYSPATEGASGREAVQDMTVPTVDSVANLLVRDVVGNKDDTHDGTSNSAKLHRIDEHVHKSQFVAPNLADSISVTANATSWEISSAFVEVIAANEINTEFDLHFVSFIFDANDEYQLEIYAGEVWIASADGSRNTNQTRDSDVPIQMPIQPANTQIQVKLACKSTNANSGLVKLKGHRY